MIYPKQPQRVPNTIRVAQLVGALRTLTILRKHVDNDPELVGQLAVQLRALLLDNNPSSPAIFFDVCALSNFIAKVFIEVPRGDPSQWDAYYMMQSDPGISVVPTERATVEVNLQEALSICVYRFEGENMTIAEAIKSRANVHGGAHYSRKWAVHDLMLIKWGGQVLSQLIKSLADCVLSIGYNLLREHAQIGVGLSFALIENEGPWATSLDVFGLLSVEQSETHTILGVAADGGYPSLWISVGEGNHVSVTVRGVLSDKCRITFPESVAIDVLTTVFASVKMTKEFTYEISLWVDGQVAEASRDAGFGWLFDARQFYFSIGAQQDLEKASLARLKIAQFAVLRNDLEWSSAEVAAELHNAAQNIDGFLELELGGRQFLRSGIPHDGHLHVVCPS